MIRLRSSATPPSLAAWAEARSLPPAIANFSITLPGYNTFNTEIDLAPNPEIRAQDGPDEVGQSGDAEAEVRGRAHFVVRPCENHEGHRFLILECGRVRLSPLLAKRRDK